MSHQLKNINYGLRVNSRLPNCSHPISSDKHRSGHTSWNVGESFGTAVCFRIKTSLSPCVARLKSWYRTGAGCLNGMETGLFYKNQWVCKHSCHSVCKHTHADSAPDQQLRFRGFPCLFFQLFDAPAIRLRSQDDSCYADGHTVSVSLVSNKSKIFIILHLPPWRRPSGDEFVSHEVRPYERWRQALMQIRPGVCVEDTKQTRPGQHCGWGKNASAPSKWLFIGGF